jgi:CDP-6-deoxy-D-xylo-4-hexulose-3-dehydrase
VMRWFDHEIFGSLAAADEVDSRGLFVGNHHYPLKDEMRLLEKTLAACG